MDGASLWLAPGITLRGSKGLRPFEIPSERTMLRDPR